MADLVVSLSADTMEFVRDMRGAAGHVKNLGQQAQQTNSLLSRMNWGMMAGGLATGLQDAASVMSNGGSFRQGLNAAGNNLIQVAAMAHPIAGAIAAAGIAAVQLAPLFSIAGAEAKKLKEEVEGIAKGMRSFAGADTDGGKASEAKRIQEEWKKLSREVDDADAKYASLMTTRNNLWMSNRNIFNRQIGGTPAAKEIERLDALMGNIKTLRNESAGKLATNEALQELIGPEANRELMEDFARQARKKTIEERKKALDDEMETRKLIGERVKKQIDDENAAIKINKQANEERQRFIADMAAKKQADAQAVRDASLNPRELLGKEALRLSFLPLTDEERSKALMKQATAAFNGGPQLSAGLIKGSIEEESFRNRKEAENRNRQFIQGIVDKLIRELRPPEPPPEIVVGGGH